MGKVIIICLALFFTGAGIGMAWPHYLTSCITGFSREEAQKRRRQSPLFSYFQPL